MYMYVYIMYKQSHEFTLTGPDNKQHCYAHHDVFFSHTNNLSYSTNLFFFYFSYFLNGKLDFKKSASGRLRPRR